MSNTQSDLLKEFERLVEEGGKEQLIELETRYDCTKGLHKWQKYLGYSDKYDFCEICDLKRR
jgi:hypothetical protein